MINIVIPMAGRGSRFSNAGYTHPKPLIPINGVPMIRLVIENLKLAIEHQFVFICQNEHIKFYNLDVKLKEWAPGCKIIGIDGITEGAACTVLTAEEIINNKNPLMIANSDQFINIDINKYINSIQNSDDGMIMTMSSIDPKWSFVEIKNGNVIRVAEKEVISNEATVGIYNFKYGKDFVSSAHEMIKRNDRVNGEFYVAPSYNYLVKNNKKVSFYNIGSEANGMYGLGTPSDLEIFLNHPVSRITKEISL